MSYTSLTLSPKSQEELLTKYKTLPVAHGHHMTIMLGIKLVELAKKAPFFATTEIGQVFTLRVVGIARSENIEAVVVGVVQMDGNVVTEGITEARITHPHITVATDETTRPFQSNVLLKAGFERVENGLELTATLAVCDD